MANKKDPDLKDMIKYAGFAIKIFKILAHAVLALGGAIKDMRRLVNEPELVRQIARLIVPEVASALSVGGGPYRGGPSSDTPGYRAEVIYVQPSYADLKKAFDWVYDGYKSTEFKPIDVCKDVSTETREIEFELVHLNKNATTETALAELEKRELRPALYEELLAFAAKYPDLQKQFPIAALGSVCRYDGSLYSPYVLWYDGGRDLYFDWFGHDWHDRCRFLAVRKP